MNSRINSLTHSPMLKHNNETTSQPKNLFCNYKYKKNNEILKNMKKFTGPSGILQLPKLDASSLMIKNTIATNTHSSLMNIEQTNLCTNRIFDDRHSQINKSFSSNKKYSKSPTHSQSPDNECDFERLDNINYVKTPSIENSTVNGFRQIKSRLGSVSSFGFSTTKLGLKTSSPSNFISIIGSRSKIPPKLSNNCSSYVLRTNSMQTSQSPLRKALSPPPSTASRNFTRIYHELDKMDSLKVGLSQETYYTEKQKELNEHTKFGVTILDKNNEKRSVSGLRSTIY